MIIFSSYKIQGSMGCYHETLQNKQIVEQMKEYISRSVQSLNSEVITSEEDFTLNCGHLLL